MKKETRKSDILIIGGSAAGLTAALTARRHHPAKSVTIVRKQKVVPIPCGIPYIFGTLHDVGKNIIPDTVLTQNKIDLIIGEADCIDTQKKVVFSSEGLIGYERLVIATGSFPVVPPIPGIDLDGVYSIHKDAEYLESFKKAVDRSQNVVVIGGGFIGVEFADEIAKCDGKNVTIIEMLPSCLGLSYDSEFCAEIEKKIKERGVNILTSTKVKSIQGNGKVAGIELADGTSVDADTVILGIGSTPNVLMASRSGLPLGPTGGLLVDRTMRTSDPATYACGDCADKVSFFGGVPSMLKLASIAAQEARIAGANLFGTHRESAGTVGVWSTSIGDCAWGAAGLTETSAIRAGYKVVTGECEGANRHPGGMPGMAGTKVKLIFERNSGNMLGGQARGDHSIGEFTNLVSALIHGRMTADEIATFQMGTHPALTASPIAYHLANAAENACHLLRS